MLDPVLKEAKRLYALGWAVHWIKPGSKAPVKSGWSGPKRDDWETLEKEYAKGYGLGVRMGQASKLEGDYFLANIDVDLKGGTKDGLREALAVVEKTFPGISFSAPSVKSPHGLRFFVKTKTPVPSGKISASNKTVKVLLPTTEINRRQKDAVEKGLLTAAELKKGYRVRNAWEVELMSIGKQVVLPPSIHPDTGVPYIWDGDIGPIPKINTDNLKIARGRGRPQGNNFQNFVPVDVDLAKLPKKWRLILESGDGVDDRSAACFSVAVVMLRKGYTDDEILTTLTDRSHFLGETAYDHRHTEGRKAAAAWVRDYCLAKAKDTVSVTRAFAHEVGVTPLLAPERVAKETVKLTANSWQLKIDRTGKDGMGPPRQTLENVILILTNAISPVLFRRDVFSYREAYGAPAPWGSKTGDAVTDDDTVHVKYWLGVNYRFEPSTNMVFDAITKIATLNSYHPVRDELEALPQWDGKKRLDTWLVKHFHAEGEPEYLAQVFRKWLVAAVTRVYEPGAKFDWLPIFEGLQGTGKSSFGSILFGQKYFVDWLPVLSDKDAALGLQGTRCVEFGELDSMRKNEVETVKAFVTRQVDKVRPPYGRKQIEIKRQCVFFGTTNREYYLIDDTGNRRFNPIKVGKLDFARLIHDRDQLWAEALYIYRGFLEPSLYLDGQAEIAVHEIRNDKRVIDEATLMTEALAEFIDAEGLKPENERFSFSKFKLSALFGGMRPLEKWKEDAKNTQIAARALKNLFSLGVFDLVYRKKIKGIHHWHANIPSKIIKKQMKPLPPSPKRESPNALF